VTDEELLRVEKMVNSLIRSNFPLQEKRDATMEEARAMGAMALFGEKYGDVVRVVRFGDSVELCGGTHTSATGNIGLFKIVSESAVAAGVRRIEALTGEAAENYVYGLESTLKTARSFFNNVPDLAGAIRKMVEENGEYKKKMEEIVRERTVLLKQDLLSKAREENGRRLIVIERNISIEDRPVTCLLDISSYGKDHPQRIIGEVSADICITLLGKGLVLMVASAVLKLCGSDIDKSLPCTLGDLVNETEDILVGISESHSSSDTGLEVGSRT
jgi:alanyl-tRNA synthetase